MRLVLAAALLGLLPAAAARAADGPPSPVCGEPHVLRQVDEALRARGQTLVFEVPPVGEISLVGPEAASRGVPPLAHCAVRGHTIGYDTNRYGMTPVYEPFIVAYTVEMRRNGLFVSVP